MKKPFVKKLTLVALALTLATLPSANAALLAEWSFDEPNGSTVSDSVGGFTGTLSPTGAALVPGGISGGAISLNRAANGFVNMNNVLNVTSGDFSLVAWIKMPVGDQTPDSILLGKHASFSKNGYYIHINQSTGLAMQSADKAFFFQGGSGIGQIQRVETPLSTTSVNDGNWHQVVAVSGAGGSKKIYIDGGLAEDTKPSQTWTGNSASFLIGGVSESGVPKGKITALVDEVRIYNHVLSESEINFLFNNPSQNPCKQQAQATAILINGAFAGANILNAGCGYTTAPTVLVQGGGGNSATATASVSNGMVTAINVTSEGCCYTNTPLIVIGSPWFAPTVDIKVSKVKVTQHVVLGRSYILESSTNLVSWTPIGSQFTADTESILSEFDVDLTGRYFRLREVP